MPVVSGKELGVVPCCSSDSSLLRERLLQELEDTGELLVDLGSDQTSLHNPFNGGYYPVPLGFHEANQLMSTDPARFRSTVQERLASPPT